ncbi:MAG: hypothetical protein IPF47_24490 [Gemmatimonadetes bacterium]|nr:hypothetical protein [Gemmatimonadota bacterium]
MRGTESRWRVRWEDARRRWTGSVATTAGASCALALAAGGTFFYNTNILHQYRSASGTQAFGLSGTFFVNKHQRPPRLAS